MSDRPCILFTAFEPSGDDHAASAIAALRRRLPGVPIYGLGGPKMAAAGCEVFEQTAAVGRMGGDSAWQVLDHFKRLGRVKRWAREHAIGVHVPTDSPAANWSYCRAIKKMYPRPTADRPATRVVHLVAPQVWAWASWRVSRLQKWSDLVLCLLPFEPVWFRAHKVNAQFIGHPAFDHPLEPAALAALGAGFPTGSPRVALLPGSRPTELKRNWPLLHEAFVRLHTTHPQACAVVGAVDEKAQATLRRIVPSPHHAIHFTHGRTDAAIHWAHAVLTVSGTVSLHIARHRKPMAIVYKVNPLVWNLFGRHLVDTRTFTLPNLIALGRPSPSRAGHVVREFVPFWGDVQPLTDELTRLIDDPARRAAQIAALDEVVDKFTAHHAGRESADHIAEQYELAVGIRSTAKITKTQ